MATAYTVTHDFATDDLIIANYVDANFTDILMAINAFDAGNLASGTIAVGRISDLTSTQCAAAFFKDEDSFTSASATNVYSGESIKAYLAAQLASSLSLSAYTNKDSSEANLLKSHAYLAATDGWASATVALTSDNNELKIFVGTTNDPAGAGAKIMEHQASGVSDWGSVAGLVAEGEYFEVTSDSGTPVIRWKSFGTLSKPVDQD